MGISLNRGERKILDEIYVDLGTLRRNFFDRSISRGSKKEQIRFIMTDDELNLKYPKNII